MKQKSSSLIRQNFNEQLWNSGLWQQGSRFANQTGYHFENIQLAAILKTYRFSAVIFQGVIGERGLTTKNAEAFLPRHLKIHQVD
ncbi:hypothetical protein [Pseudovibrio denitrificans]|uniref:hypothetical protein n=1 Tax=Pseudovibrio denitrificans TaxID=258256 RepID=UPI0006D2C3A6|nr:hypothetical protein [Pseudovibrio denitrificans]